MTAFDTLIARLTTNPGNHPHLTPADLRLLADGLRAAFLDRATFDRLNLRLPVAGRPEPGPIPPDLRTRFVTDGASALRPDELTRLAVTPEWQAELWDELDGPSAHWVDQIERPRPRTHLSGPRSRVWWLTLAAAVLLATGGVTAYLLSSRTVLPGSAVALVPPDRVAMGLLPNGTTPRGAGDVVRSGTEFTHETAVVTARRHGWVIHLTSRGRGSGGYTLTSDGAGRLVGRSSGRFDNAAGYDLFVLIVTDEVDPAVSDPVGWVSADDLAAVQRHATDPVACARLLRDALDRAGKTAPVDLSFDTYQHVSR